MNQDTKTDTNGAGIYLPPPFLFIGFFIVGYFLQQFIPLPRIFVGSSIGAIVGGVFLVLSLIFLGPALNEFFKNRNTLLTMKPTNSLQTSGVYSKTRNPIYVSFLLIYIGLSFAYGVLWLFILIPFLIFSVNKIVIEREEAYLGRKFGNQYKSYCQRVGRWLW